MAKQENPVVRAERFKMMFGCTEAQLKAIYDNPIAKISGPGMTVMSILSDAQELIAMGGPASLEEARLYINRAKHGISEYFIQCRACGYVLGVCTCNTKGG